MTITPGLEVEEEATSLPVPTSVDGLVCRLILNPGDRQKITFRRTVDAHTALSRALAEYLGSKSIVWEGGRLVRFNKVQHTWAAPEDEADYPVLVINELGDAEYDGAGLTPILAECDDDTERWVRQVSELAQKFEVQIWTTDPEERMALTAMLEDAFEPAEFMTGCRLELPYYFGARATYEKTNIGYRDSGITALRGQRVTYFTVNANVPQYRPVGELQTMRVRRVLIVDDPTDPDGAGD